VDFPADRKRLLRRRPGIGRVTVTLTLRAPRVGFPYRFAAPSAGQYRSMDLRKPVVLVALVGSLVACGDNTDVGRGETNCDSSGQEAANPHDASCEETGTPANGG
jgi:hypothetical protein